MNLISKISPQHTNATFNRLAAMAKRSPDLTTTYNGHVGTYAKAKVCDKNAEIVHTEFQGLDAKETVTLSAGGVDGGFSGMKKPTSYEAITRLKNGALEHCRAYNPKGVDFFTDIQCVTHKPLGL